ncbi:threonine/serine dehydratase [bacterium]|nr:threonine/serine dehydratase [bacterium]
MGNNIIDISHIKDAKKALKPFIKKTTLKYSHFLSSLYLKLENTQLSHSFKIRGAFNKILKLTFKEKQKGIITCSSGNHGLATAIAAKKLDIAAKIVIPETTPRKKVDKIKKYNVDLLLYGDYDEAEQKALELARQEGKTYISPYNDFDIIAGQGTIGLEILEEFPEVEKVLVPIGGGGLVAGIAIAIKNKNRAIEVIGAQSEASPVMYESLKANRILRSEELRIKESIADGLSGGIEENSITFTITQKNVDEVILVKEETIKEAIRLLWEKDNQIVEGAGAVGPAVVIENKEQFKNKKTVIISGGNINDELFNKITKVSE